jgi:hypothetical protein
MRTGDGPRSHRHRPPRGCEGRAPASSVAQAKTAAWPAMGRSITTRRSTLPARAATQPPPAASPARSPPPCSVRASSATAAPTGTDPPRPGRPGPHHRTESAMTRSCYGALVVAESRHRDDRARVARHALATKARLADPRTPLARCVKPVLAYACSALTALASVACGISNNESHAPVCRPPSTGSTPTTATRRWPSRPHGRGEAAKGSPRRTERVPPPVAPGAPTAKPEGAPR